MGSAALKNSEDEAVLFYGADFLSLFNWACDRNLLSVFDANYHVFGQSPKHIDPHRIFEELKLPHFENILIGWQDNLEVRELWKYIEELKFSPEILKEYPAIPRATNADEAKTNVKNLTDSDYLLALSYSRPFQSKLSYSLRYQSMMRLWCYVHCFIRYRKEGRHDKVLSQVARYLILDANDGKKIELLDIFFERLDNHLKDKEPSFELCDYYIADVSKYLARQLDDKLAQGQKNFLNRLSRISKLEFELIDVPTSSHSQISKNPFFKKKTSTPAYIDLPFEDDSGVKFSENPVQESTEDEEEDLGYLEIEVSPNDTLAEQILISRGIFIQRAEQSHYLPWSWDKALPTELSSLDTWLEKLLESSDKTEALAGALIWLAHHYGRSLETVLTIEVSDEPSKEWTISEDFKYIRRLPIRRHSAYRPNKRTDGWVAPLGEVIEVRLPNKISKVIQNSSESLDFEIKQLSQLWQTNHKISLLRWLNLNKPSELERLTSGMFSNNLGQNIFNQTGDSSFARAWSSHPRNALPAACGYGSWDIENLTAGKTINKALISSPKVSLVGSMLLPSDETLLGYIKDLAAVVSASKSLIDFHNSFTYYTVVSLNAALGSRHLNDPYESLSNFYFSSDNEFVSCVYLEDKNDDIHSGRLVPLCSSAQKLALHYFDYLKDLIKQLTPTAPHLAQNIDLLLQAKPAAMPLFFLLDGSLRWQSLSQKSLLEELPKFPLPENTFRHRLSQRLTSLGLPSDILEAWLGHGERGVSTYGDFSPRNWLDDAKQYLPLLEKAFSDLNFPEIDYSFETLIPSSITALAEEVEAKPFGSEARAARRKRTIVSIKERTANKISEFLEGRNWEDVSEEEFASLVKDITSGGKESIAISYPMERLEVLYAELDANAPNLLRKIRKRVLSLKQERTHLKSSVVSSIALYPKLKNWAEVQRKQLYARSLSFKQSAQIGTALLAIEKRISYLAMLQEIADNQNYQLLQYGRECFIRYSEELNSDDLVSAGQQHKIPYKTASFLDNAKTSKKALNAREELSHSSIEDLANYLGLNLSCSFDELLDALCQVIDQVNLITLPGVVAAGLSARQPATSLSIQDYVRLKYGKALTLPESINDVGELELESLVPVNIEWLKCDTDGLKKNANSFSKELSEIISRYKKSNAKAIAKEVIDLCKTWGDKVSSAVLNVGYWIANVITTGKYQGRRKSFTPLAENSISTYLGSLMTSFKELAYDIDIFTLSDDGFYELYERMLDFKTEKNQDTEYFARRLISYHSYFLSQGFPEIDWSELDFVDKRRVVSSGLITESDYLNALNYLKRQYKDEEHSNVFQFILFLCYRFGLRLQEAVCLLRKDWKETDGQIWLTIRNNKYRSLKTESGRRAIPLLFELTSPEKRVIKKIFDRYELLAGKDKNYPVLSELASEELKVHSLVSCASREIIHALRQVTGNNHLVLHHARHSFLNRLAAIAYEIDTSLTSRLVSGLSSASIKEKMLGDNHASDRRSSMALAVIMGHVHPSTSLKSYNHLMTDWADEFFVVKNERVDKLKTAIQINEWKKHKIEKNSAIQSTLFKNPTLPLLVQMMRYVALGKTFQQAADILEISPLHASNLEKILNNVSAIKMDEADKLNSLTTSFGIRDYLSRISESAWRRILSSCEKEFSVKTKNTVILEEIPYLVGTRRQILMCTDAHYETAKALIHYFDIPEDCFSVLTHINSTTALQQLEANGLNRSMADESKPLDLLYWRMADGSQVLHQNYSALWLNGRVLTNLRSSYELTLMYLLALYLRTLETQTIA